MKKKISLNSIIDEFLTTFAESEGITEPKEIKAYIKDRKKLIKAFMVKKGVK